MSDQQIQDFCDGMLDWFGVLPNPEHHPIQFQHCINVYQSIVDCRVARKRLYNKLLGKTDTSLILVDNPGNVV